VGSRSGITQGRLVFADLEYGDRRLEAVLSRSIGSPGSPESLIDAVALDHGLPEKFGDDVVLLAREAALSPWDRERREDFRDLFTVTIDPVDARDFDDAISIGSSEGHRVLYVHIADVARYVPHGSQLDREARKRGTSVYLPDRVIPMLPEVLSNDACSLRPGEEKATRTVVMKFDENGKRLDFSIVPSVIRSDRRMTYEEALEYLQGGGSDDELRNLFSDLGALSSDLDSLREQRGALDLETSEYRVMFDDKGRPSEFRPVPSDISHRMIENFMVEANRAVADHCSWGGLPVLYRVHDKPTENAVEKLLRKLEEFDIPLPGGRIHSPANLRSLLRGIDSRALRDLVSEHVLRSLQKAVYMPVNQGHFGLALRSYMHFTSPIRRYPDLIVHQMLAIQENGGIPSLDEPAAVLAQSACLREDNAESAERDAVELMALLYLSGRTGSTYRGVVTGVKRFGIFVRLEGVPVEGLAHRSDIRRSGIPFQGPGGIFHEGSAVKVAVLSVDIMERKLALITVKD
jgi:ribonuclease R